VKILILTPNYPRKNAVMNGIFIHQQVKALQSLGAECHVLLLHNWYPKFNIHQLHPNWRKGYDVHRFFFEEFEGIKIHHVPVVMRMPDRFFKNNYYEQAANAIVKYLKKNSETRNADFLYAHFLTDCGYIATLVKQKLKMKIVAIARGDDVHDWPEQKPFLVQHLDKVFRSADILLANSKRLAIDTQKWMNADTFRKVEVVYNGVDFKRFSPVTNVDEKMALLKKFGLSPKHKHIICVANPIRLKGWIELLSAIKALGDKLEGWKLVIVAINRNNSDVIDLLAERKEMGIADKIVFKGQVDPDELSLLYKACDVFILPSYNEGMANALLEAMATGLACITTDVGGHAEVIENGKDGVLIAPRDSCDIASALEKVCLNEELLIFLGRNARARMLTYGSYRDNAQMLYSLLEKRSESKC
jgi:glycosyltransferase involved in cell wall biosynthesis